MSAFDLFGRGRAVEVVVLLLEEEIRDARLLENAREVEDDISFVFVFDNCLMPHRPSSRSGMVKMENSVPRD
jgi:hypothetical protein